MTLGKIVGGGLAIGVMCGKKEIMEMSNTSSFEKSQKGPMLEEVHFLQIQPQW